MRALRNNKKPKPKAQRRPQQHQHTSTLRKHLIDTSTEVFCTRKESKMETRRSKQTKRSVIQGFDKKASRKERKRSKANNGQLSSEILPFALSWLTPKDLGRTAQVCTQWKNEISPYEWKAAGKNENPQAFRALKVAMERGEKGAAFEKIVSAIAQGLATYREESPAALEPEPKLKGEDLFLLLEVQGYKKKEAWCKCLSDSLQDFQTDGFVEVDFGDPLDEPLSSSPFLFAGNSRDLPPGGKTMHVTLSLWRADTGQTYRFCADREMYCWEDLDSEQRESYCVFEGDNAKPTEGSFQRLRNRMGYNYLCPDIVVSMTQDMPILGAHSFNDVKYRIDKSVASLRFCLGDDDCANNNVQSERHFLLFIEALDWK